MADEKDGRGEYGQHIPGTPCLHSSVSLVDGHYKCDLCGELAQEQDWGQAIAINAVLDQARVIANGTIPVAADVTRLRHLLKAMDKAMGNEPEPMIVRPQ